MKNITGLFCKLSRQIANQTKFISENGCELSSLERAEIFEKW